MVYYAKTGEVTTADMSGLDGWIEISERQYQQAIAGMTEGLLLKIENDKPVLAQPEQKHLDEPIPTDELATPTRITRAQGKAILIQSGLWQQVLDYVASLENPTEQALAEVALHDTTEWLRDSPFLGRIAIYLSLSDGDLDQLFSDAAQIAL